MAINEVISGFWATTSQKFSPIMELEMLKNGCKETLSWILESLRQLMAQAGLSCVEDLAHPLG